MFAKRILAAMAAGIAAVRACDNAGPLGTNPYVSPTPDNGPAIGQPFTVEWTTNYPNKSPVVTLSLYNGCPNNCKELTDIAGWYTNNGSFVWTPDASLQPGSDYGLLFINEEPCLTVWTYFTLHPAGTTVNTTVPAPAAGSGASVVSGGASSAAVSSAASGTVAGAMSTSTTTIMVTTVVPYPSGSVSGGMSTSTTTVMVTTMIPYVAPSKSTLTLTTTVYETGAAPSAASTLLTAAAVIAAEQAGPSGSGKPGKPSGASGWGSWGSGGWGPSEMGPGQGGAKPSDDCPDMGPSASASPGTLAEQPSSMPAATPSTVISMLVSPSPLPSSAAAPAPAPTTQTTTTTHSSVQGSLPQAPNTVATVSGSKTASATVAIFTGNTGSNVRPVSGYSFGAVIAVLAAAMAI